MMKKLIDKNKENITLIAKLLSTPEGRILAAGFIMFLFYIIGLTVTSIMNSDVFRSLVAMTITHVFFGRAAAISFGNTVMLSHASVILINILIETIMVLIFFPLFVFSFNKLLNIQALSNFFSNVNEAAEENRDKIKKYGMIGLFLFVWFPFWMTGPLVGCVIGFLIGLKNWINLSVVLSGTYLAILCWSLFLRKLQEKLASINPYMPIVFIVAVISVVLAGHLIHLKIKKKKTSSWPEAQS